jgi:hypothetical protein
VAGKNAHSSHQVAPLDVFGGVLFAACLAFSTASWPWSALRVNSPFLFGWKQVALS